MLMPSYLAAIACNDERVRKVIQREILSVHSIHKHGSVFSNKVSPSAIDIRETCAQSLNELYFQNGTGKESPQSKERVKQSSLQQQPKLQRAQSSSGLLSTPREVKKQASFSMAQKQQGLAEACERIPQKVTLRCSDGTVIVNGDQAPLFVPKLNLTKITENREIYHPLPVARRAVLAQNDEIFQNVMQNKSKYFKYWKESESNKSEDNCWSSKSDVPSEPSETTQQYESDSDMESFYQDEFEMKQSQKPRRRRTFTFSSVNSILDKVCKIQPQKEDCLLSETGFSVMQSIQFERNKSYNCLFTECGVEV